MFVNPIVCIGLSFLVPLGIVAVHSGSRWRLLSSAPAALDLSVVLLLMVLALAALDLSIGQPAGPSFLWNAAFPSTIGAAFFSVVALFARELPGLRASFSRK